MRRTQSVRHRPLATFGSADELGIVKEDGETAETAMRIQLMEKDKEIDKLKAFISDLKKEFKDLELILEGSQRENQKMLSVIEQAKTREKVLERALAQVAGENWQDALELSPEPVMPKTSLRPPPPAPTGNSELTSAHLQQIRLLVLGMEQRLQDREESLTKEIQKAESATQRFDELRREVLID